AALADRRDVVFLIDGESVMPITLDASTALQADEVALQSKLTAAARLTAEQLFAPANEKPGTKRIAIEPPMAVNDRCRVTIRFTARSAVTTAESSYFVPLVTLVDATNLRNFAR